MASAPRRPRQQTIALLERVGIGNAAGRVDAYPHQFSGGQRQRITIAMALACEPDLLIADEPTTALDVTIQGQILDLIHDLVLERSMALLLISHDLGVIAQNVERMMVMYGGSVIESGSTRRVFGHMAHPYTRGLFGARPRLGAPAGTRLTTIDGTVPELVDLPAGCAFSDRCAWAQPACVTTRAAAETRLEPGHEASCLRLDAVMAGQQDDATNHCHRDTPRCWSSTRSPAPTSCRAKSCGASAPLVHALQGVSFTMQAGRSMGIVGESGSGKSTLARLVMALEAPTSGRVSILGRDMATPGCAQLAPRAARLPDGVPGPLRLARSAPDRAAHRHRAIAGPGRHDSGPNRRAGRAKYCCRSGCAPPTWTSTRTSSPVASASASRLRAR